MIHSIEVTWTSEQMGLFCSDTSRRAASPNPTDQLVCTCGPPASMCHCRKGVFRANNNGVFATQKDSRYAFVVASRILDMLLFQALARPSVLCFLPASIQFLAVPFLAHSPRLLTCPNPPLTRTTRTHTQRQDWSSDKKSVSPMDFLMDLRFFARGPVGPRQKERKSKGFPMDLRCFVGGPVGRPISVQDFPCGARCVQRGKSAAATGICPRRTPASTSPRNKGIHERAARQERRISHSYLLEMRLSCTAALLCCLNSPCNGPTASGREPAAAEGRVEGAHAQRTVRSPPRLQ